MNLGNLTPGQLEVYQVIQRIRMAWVVLIVFLLIFIVLIGIVVWAAIDGQTGMAIVLSIVDGIVGWTLKHIVSFLFPHESTSISN